MTDDSLAELDEILTEVLADESESEPEYIEETAVTIAHSVSESVQESITTERIEELATKLDVPESTVTMAMSLRDQYREQRGGLDGTSLELVATACLYCACKVTEVPLDPTSFVKADDTIVTRRGLLRRSKDIASTVGLDPSAFFSSSHYIDRYCDELGLGQDVRDRAHEIVDLTEETGLSSGKSPSGWAAAAVYNACLDVGEKRTQDQISSVANTSEVTVRNRYQEQREALRADESLPSDPVAAIEEITSTSHVSQPVRATARDLVVAARQRDKPVDEEPTLWALAALKRAGELVGETVSSKTLSQFTEESSSAISTRAKTLRQVNVVARTELDDGSEDGDESEPTDSAGSTGPASDGTAVLTFEDKLDTILNDLTSSVETAIETGHPEQVPSAVNSREMHIVQTLEPEVDGATIENVRTAHGNVTERLRELVTLYQNNELQIEPGLTPERTLERKLKAQLASYRETLTDIATQN